MKALILPCAVLPLLFIASCSNPADDVPAAAVQAPAQNASAPSAPPAAGGQFFAFGPETATIEFVGSKVTGSHNGGFREVAGEFRVVDGKLADTGNKVVIDAASIWSDNERLTGHLKSADFFDVAQFPTATFETTNVEHTGATAKVTGNLTLHGVTKQISFPATVDVSQTGVTAKAEFSIKRFDFNIKYPGRANDLIRDEVVLKLDVKAAPGRAKFPAA
jgi:polyisoprenoid-binding protein YceI